MEFILKIIYLVSFVGLSLLSFLILNDSNLSMFFKKGKVGSIRMAYILISVITGFLAASALTKLIQVFYEMITL